MGAEFSKQQLKLGLGLSGGQLSDGCQTGLEGYEQFRESGTVKLRMSGISGHMPSIAVPGLHSLLTASSRMRIRMTGKNHTGT